MKFDHIVQLTLEIYFFENLNRQQWQTKRQIDEGLQTIAALAQVS